MTDLIPTSVYVLTFDCPKCGEAIFACTRAEDPRDDLSLRCAKCEWEGKRSFFDGQSICRFDVDNRSVEWIEHRTIPRAPRTEKQKT
jgi:predicted RNA-binding Zn-ribbon protein involved in translation (DUF1610 family)